MEKSGRKGSFGLVFCLDRAAGTREGGITGGRDMGIGDRATAGVRAELVMSSVSWCNWVVRPVRVVLIVYSEAFWHLVISWKWYCR